MRFNCGSALDRNYELTCWHQWFAWYPIRRGADCIWLEKVWRKGVRSGGYDVFEWNWKYEVIT